MDTEEFSNWLMRQLAEHHMTCNQLSKITGLNHVTIGYYVTATTSPTFASLKLILDAFGKKVQIIDKD